MKRTPIVILMCLCLEIAQAQTAKLDFLYGQYVNAWNQNDFINSKRYALPWLSLYKDLGLPRDARYADVECTLAFCYFLQRDYENCKTLYKNTYNVNPQRISTGIFSSYTDTLHTDIEDKERLLKEIVEMEEITNGKESIPYATALISIAEFYNQLSPYRAKTFYEQAIQILRSNDALSVRPEIVLRLAQIYIGEKEISMAASLIDEITPYITVQTASPLVFASWILLNNQVKIQQFDYIASQYFIDEVFKRASVVLSHPYVQNCIELAQADLALANKNYSLAESMYLGVANNIDKKLDTLSLWFYTSCRLGQLYVEQDNLHSAEITYRKLLERDLTKAEKKVVLERLAGIYLDLGDYMLARKNYLATATLVLELYGEHHMEYAKSLNNLANIAFRQHQFELAQKAYIESTIVLKEIDVPSMYSLTLCNLANVYIFQGKMAEAELCYKEALGLIENQLGSHSIEYSDALNNMAIMYHINGEYKRAYRLYLEAQEIRESTVGKDSRKYLDSEICLFKLYSDLDISSMATPILQSIIKKKSDIVKQEFWHLSERQRKDFWDESKYAFEQTYPSYMYNHSQDTTLRALAYDNELFIKGLLLNTSAQIRFAVNSSDNPIVKAVYSQLSSNKEVLTLYQQTGKSQNEIDSVKRIIDELDKQLVLLCSDYRLNMEKNSIDWRSIQKNLSTDEVAIEFSHFNVKGKTHYVAILLRHDVPYPDYIELESGEEIESLINDYKPNIIYTKNAESLYRAIWGNIVPYIKPHETIYFAPSGIIHQLAIESLPYDNEHTMADIYNIVRLSSTREVVGRRGELKHNSATLYGGIQYNVDIENLQAESEKYQQFSANRSFENDTINRGSVKYLAGSKTEVESINNMLKQNNLQVQLYTSLSANEESFKSLSGKHQNILHIATHGFFWSDSTAHKKEFFSQYQSSNTDGMSPSIDPLNRCGLLFAGANTALQGRSSEIPEGVQDGVLTAKEISLLDLRDADLVVLSACETGKGEITGDGVFGLQRAFKQSGGQTIVMSLWPVNDAVTQLLMSEFYRNWVANHQSKREAFRNAQNIVRSKYEEPVYWAGFIMLD